MRANLVGPQTFRSLVNWKTLTRQSRGTKDSQGISTGPLPPTDANEVKR